MLEKLPYIEVPDWAKAVVGEPDEGTRMYRRWGPIEQFALWCRVVNRICKRGTISPGGVLMYTKCTRAGVHKRMREGRLTAFLYHVEKGKRVFGGRKVEGRPYIDIPLSECIAWGQMLKDASGEIASSEAWGDGDFVGDFLAPPARKRKMRKRIVGGR